MLPCASSLSLLFFHMCFKMIKHFLFISQYQVAEVASYIFSQRTKSLEAENVHLCRLLPMLRYLSSVLLIKMRTMAKIILRAP